MNFKIELWCVNYQQLPTIQHHWHSQDPAGT